jgi:hypothetical protein
MTGKMIIIGEDQEMLIMIALRVLYSEVLTGNVDLQASRIETVYEELFGDHTCSDYRTIRKTTTS